MTFHQQGKTEDQDQQQLSSLSFKETLLEIARLEKEHGFLGVSMLSREAVRTGGFDLRAENYASHVLAILKETVALSEEFESIPLVKPYDDPAID